MVSSSGFNPARDGFAFQNYGFIAGPQLIPTVLQQMFAFPPDMDRVPTDINRLDNQVLVRYHESEWRRFE